MSNGFRQISKPVFSLEDPIPNWSMLVFPRITASAARKRAITVASYGGTNPFRILEAQVVSKFFVHMASFMATGTPTSAPVESPAAIRRSTARASSITDSSWTEI